MNPEMYFVSLIEFDPCNLSLIGFGLPIGFSLEFTILWLKSGSKLEYLEIVLDGVFWRTMGLAG